MSLFKLVPDKETSVDELISNATPTSTVFKAVPSGNSGIINIVESMQIATNDIIPGSYLANKIPTCILKEYELIANSSVSQLLYYLRSLGTTANGSVSDLLNQAATTLGNIGSNAENLLSGPVGGAIKDFIGDNTKEILDKATQPLQEILKNNEQFSGSMTPYQNLYLRKATNFKYVLPFYTDKKKDITNAFSDSQTGLLAGNLFAKYVTGGAKLAYETVAKNLLFATPGAYIEQPKFFDAGTNGESYEIKFDLINTINSDKVQTHFDLLFLLAYQNLPYRKDIARVTLPKIYTFIIPGEIYLPYAYISSLKIDFVGNRRKMKIIHPKFIASDVGPTTNTSGGTLLDCIVPEVYSVSMTVTGLTTPAANYMIADELFKITSTSVDVAPIALTGIRVPSTPAVLPTTPLDLSRPPPPTRIVVPTVRDNIGLVNLNNTTFINSLTQPQPSTPLFNLQPGIIP
jgi:hypothetical protein